MPAVNIQLNYLWLTSKIKLEKGILSDWKKRRRGIDCRELTGENIPMNVLHKKLCYFRSEISTVYFSGIASHYGGSNNQASVKIET